MKKVFLGVLAVVSVGVLGVLGMASTKADTAHLERSVTVNASPDDVAAYATDLKLVNEWSPWVSKDPSLQQSYSDTTAGVGAWYGWEGNEDVGSGKMSITAATDTQVVVALEFYTPFEGKADATTSWTAAGDQTTVTWAYDQDADFNTKVMQVFLSFEDLLGGDYEAGLAMLQPLVEQAAKDRIAAEEAAVVAAAAALAEEAAQAAADAVK